MQSIFTHQNVEQAIPKTIPFDKENAMHSVLTHQNEDMRGNPWLVGEQVEKQIEYLDEAIRQYNKHLEDIEMRCFDREENLEELSRATTHYSIAMMRICEEFEREVKDKNIIRDAQIKFREKTKHVFSKSYFMNRARIWPQGYPGDYKTLEGVYRNTPLSSGIGFCLDRHFLSTALATAVRERLATLSELLKSELAKKQNPKILNLACGSCRELFETALDIQKAGAQLTCVDFDSDALNFAVNRLSHAGLPSEQTTFRKYNVLRMVSHERNLKEFGMQDVIYSTGYFDYLEDDVLVRLLGALYDLLNPGGSLISSFKDCRRYKTQEYHWGVNWTGFHQRTEEEMWALFGRADIPHTSLRTLHDKTGVIIFFIATK